MSELLPLLVELGTEELPPKALPELAQAFFDGVLKGLASRRIEVPEFDASAPPRPLYTPRRLAILLPAVGLQQPQQFSEVLGPYVNIALDAAGQPTPALLGFAQKNGVAVDQLERVTDAKGMRFAARSSKPGARTADLLPEIVAEALKALPVPKPMRWGSRDYAFVRPAHWLVMLLGRDVVDGQVMGLRADRMSRGHRFHHDKPVWINEAGDYLEALRNAHVLADPAERRQRLREQIAVAAGVAGGQARVVPELLEEVNCLVEWPKSVLCSFDRDFLAVPQEALITTMESNQKFFPVLDASGRLTEHFIGIANIESRDEAEVRKGYERVIRPRFADARFFYDADLRQGLAAMAGGLASVTYQQKLGSYADKSARVAALAASVAAAIGLDPALATRAAGLAKADLQSRLVGEFPELQGVAGRYYATAAGEPAEVAAALDEAYQPRFAGDAIAPSPLGRALAVAERLDTLAGGFAAGLKPSGNKDPFALRRNALGLARSLIEGGLDLPLRGLLVQALAAQPIVTAPAMIGELNDFVIERLRGYYGDQGIPSAHFDAVADSGFASLTDFDRRLKAIGSFARLPAAAALAAANKRIRNLLRKVDGAIPATVDATLFADPAERALLQAVDAAIAATDPLLAQRDYVGTLQQLAGLREPVDEYFKRVMVMADNPAVRDNRLALLKRLSDRFAAVAAVDQLDAG